MTVLIDMMPSNPRCKMIVKKISPVKLNVSGMENVVRPVTLRALTAVNKTSMNGADSPSLYATGSDKMHVDMTSAKK